jgi:hypothetical protein
VLLIGAYHSMSPRQHVEGLIISTLLLFVSSSFGYALTDDEVSAPQIYPIRADGSTGEGFILREGLFTPEGLLNDNNGRMPLAEVRFPKLTSKQRKFAVNPGYMSYYNDDFAEIEDERDILEQSMRKEKGIEEEAEEIIKEGEAIEKAIQQERQNQASEDDEIEEMIDNGDEYALEPAGAKKAAAFSSIPDISRIEEIAEELRVNDIYFTTIVAVSSAVAIFAIIGAGVCYHRLQRNAKATEDIEYPAYGVTGPGKETSPTSGGDRKLAQNAQMYHYQHQKQQMIAFDSHQNNANRGGALVSDDESDEGEEGDYTVYECPGLATTGEMEVRNPLFSEDQTPKASSMPHTQSSQ